MAALLFVSALQAGLQLTSIALTISAEVLDAQIRSFYQQYQKQCDLLAHLYRLIDRLNISNSTSQELMQDQVFLTKAWDKLQAVIHQRRYENEEKQINLPKVKAMKTSKKLFADHFFGASKKIVGSVKTLLKFYIACKQWQGPPRAQIVRQRFKLLVKKAMVQNGIIKPLEDVGMIKKFFQNNSKTEITKHFVRFLAFFNGILLLINGSINIHRLRNDLEATKDRFSKENFEKDIIGFMGDLEGLATNVKDLAHASKATINELHKYYLIHCLAYTRDANRANDLLAKFVPADYGLDDAKLERIEEWEAEVKKAKSIEPKKNYNDPNLADHYVERLERYLELYRDLLEKEKIDKLFAELTERLSSMVSKESMVINEVYKDCEQYSRFSGIITKTLNNKRNTKFQYLTLQQKIKIDKKVITKAQRVFLDKINNIYIDSEDQEGYQKAASTLSSRDQMYIAITLMKGVDQFYGTDESGASIYGHLISDFKSQETQQQVRQSTLYKFKQEKKAISELLPLQWDDEVQEANEVWRLLKKAQRWVQNNKKSQLNKVLSIKIPDEKGLNCLEGLPQLYQRFIRIKLKDDIQKNEKGQQITTVDINGCIILCFTIDKQTFTYSTSTFKQDEIVRLCVDQQDL